MVGLRSESLTRFSTVFKKNLKVVCLGASDHCALGKYNKVQEHNKVED